MRTTVVNPFIGSFIEKKYRQLYKQPKTLMVTQNTRRIDMNFFVSDDDDDD